MSEPVDKERRASWRRALTPLTPLYAAALRVKGRMLAGGVPEQRHLLRPVISVGSLSAGGAGKTPVVLLMAEMLRGRGYTVRILTRGYGRRSSAVERVDPDGSAERYGDEPLLLAHRSRVPVYVGADRYQAGVLSEAEGDFRTCPTSIHLLDDGFQHRRLARDMDVVLLTRKDVDDRLLPAGNLREAISALRGADVVVLREEEAAELHPRVATITSGMPVPPPIWVVRRRMEWASAGHVPRRPLAFCGIARPEGFFAMLEAEGARPVDRTVFPDHHRYGYRDVTRLVAAAQRAGANGFLTTEKDAVKLTRAMRARMEEAVGPVSAPELRVEMLDEKSAMDQTIELVTRMDRRRPRGGSGRAGGGLRA